MTMTPPETAQAVKEFNTEIEALKGDALLQKKVVFDQLPKAKEGEKDLRLQQSLALEYCLRIEFGLTWKKVLDDYLARDAGSEKP